MPYKSMKLIFLSLLLISPIESLSSVYCLSYSSIIAYDGRLDAASMIEIRVLAYIVRQNCALTYKSKQGSKVSIHLTVLFCSFH